MVEAHQSHRHDLAYSKHSDVAKCRRQKNDQRIGRYRETYTERASGAIDSKTNFKNKSKFRSVMSNKKASFGWLLRQLLCEFDSECIDMGYKLRSQCAKHNSKEFLDNINQCTKNILRCVQLSAKQKTRHGGQNLKRNLLLFVILNTPIE